MALKSFLLAFTNSYMLGWTFGVASQPPPRQLHCNSSRLLLALKCRARNVRRYMDVWQFQVSLLRSTACLSRQYVKPGSHILALPEGVANIVCQKFPSCGIDEGRIRPHSVDHLARNRAPCLGRQGAAQNHNMTVSELPRYAALVDVIPAD